MRERIEESKETFKELMGKKKKKRRKALSVV